MDRGSTPAGGGLAAGPSEGEISRALDRLAKARVRLRDVSSRRPPPGRPRSEAVERARRAVEEAAAALAHRPDDPEVVKTHALAEIAEVMAVRREGFATLGDYERAVSPPLDDPVADELTRAERSLAEARAEWEHLKRGLVTDDATTIDLTREPPAIERG